MKTDIRKFALLSVIGVFVFTAVTSSLLYDTFRRAVKKLPMEFDNWGEEFIYDWEEMELRANEEKNRKSKESDK